MSITSLWMKKVWDITYQPLSVGFPPNRFPITLTSLRRLPIPALGTELRAFFSPLTILCYYLIDAGGGKQFNSEEKAPIQIWEFCPCLAHWLDWYIFSTNQDAGKERRLFYLSKIMAGFADSFSADSFRFIYGPWTLKMQQLKIL